MIRIVRLLAPLFVVLGLVMADGSALAQPKDKAQDRKEQGGAKSKEKKQHKHLSGKDLVGDKIRDIFDADRLTRGELVLERRSTEIDTLVRRVVREFPFAGDRDLDIAVEPARIMVDRVRVERLVDDLLTSAVGRTETGDRIALVLE